MNCEKRGRKCLGYRSEHDLVFRDETSAVLLKGQSSRNPFSTDLRTQAWLLPTIELQATTLLFKNYARAMPYVNVAARRFQGAYVSTSCKLAVHALSIRSLSKYDRQPLLAAKADRVYLQCVLKTYAGFDRSILIPRQSSFCHKGSSPRSSPSSKHRALDRRALPQPIRIHHL